MSVAGPAASLPRSLRENVSLTPASFGPSSAGGRARRACYEWKSYDIIPCNSCGDTTSSDNFEVCRIDFTNCYYTPKHAVDACGFGDYCFHEQYRLEAWYCDMMGEEN